MLRQDLGFPRARHPNFPLYLRDRPPPPPSLLLKLPWRESALSRTNGYSIAEILLVFGIIASVLIGVWAVYTMLAEETDVKAAVAEIQVIREAAVQFKHNDGGGKYNNMTLATFGSYLGDGVAQVSDDSIGVTLASTFGEDIFLSSDAFTFGGTNGGNLLLTSFGISSLNVCKQILEHFGEVQAFDRPIGEGGLPARTNYYIPAGKSIFGYVGGPDEYTSGCIYNVFSRKTTLTLRID